MDDEQLLRTQSELLRNIQPGKPLHVEQVDCPCCGKTVNVDINSIPEGLSIICNTCESEFLIEAYPLDKV